MKERIKKIVIAKDDFPIKKELRWLLKNLEVAINLEKKQKEAIEGLKKVKEYIKTRDEYLSIKE